MTTTPTEHTGPVAFHEWIVDQGNGTTDDEITAALAGVVEAVGHFGKKGEVVVKIKVEPGGSHNRQVLTACHVEAKPPTAAPEQSIFYIGQGGGLHRDDPFSPRLEGVIDPTTTPPRVIDPTTGAVTE